MDYITRPAPYKIISQEGNEAVFEIENLYPGYGLTLGNALRRVLLSSLPGAAITLVKIKGVDHEFSTMTMVYEDVIEILLNLKQVRFKLFGDEPQTAFLRVKGEREVKAQDIEAPSQVEVVNVDHHIATLTDKKSELEIELRIERGIGYQTVEQRHKEKMPIGTIAIDSIFTPVRKVNYQIEDMRVGERTDYNRLLVTLETDGTITPENAFNESVNILITQFQGMLSLGSAANSEQESEKEFEPAGEELKSEAGKAGGDLTELGFSTRTLGALSRAGIVSLADLKDKSLEELTSLRGMGEKGINEIKSELAKLGIELK